jgi:hypothetical protein
VHAEAPRVEQTCDRGDIDVAYVASAQVKRSSQELFVGRRSVSCCRFLGHEVKLPAPAAQSPWGQS